MLQENFSLSRMPGVCILLSGRECEDKNWGFSSREGMTRLEESRTNWHRPRRRGAVWCSRRTLCGNSHQSCCTAGSYNCSQTCMYTHIVCRHECIIAHRQWFHCNLSLSVTVTGSIFICHIYFHDYQYRLALSCACVDYNMP